MKKRWSDFTYLNITQFLGAFNDNVFRFLTAFFVISQLGGARSELIMASVAATFVMPFLLFAAAAGKIADRFSKRNVLLVAKWIELFVMLFGTICFALQSLWGAYLSLFLMTAQSTFFGPAKYGIVPEIVSKAQTTKANGLLTAFTYLAVIIGTFFATWITVIFSNNFLLSGLFCSFFAFIGLFTCYFIPKTPPAGSSKKIHPFFLLEIYRTLVLAKKEKLLLTSIFGVAFFLFFGGFVQTNIIPFGIKFLKLSNNVQGGYLFLCTAVGIGIGSLIAGFMARRSKKNVELALVPVAILGIAIAFLLFPFALNSVFSIVVLLIVLGIFGGIFLVPQEAFIQIFSPLQLRGQMIAASSFLGFLGVLFSAGFIALFDWMGLTSLHGFQAMGVISLFVAIFYFFNLHHHLLSFFLKNYGLIRIFHKLSTNIISVFCKIL